MLQEYGIPVTVVNKVKEGRPHIVDHIKNGDIVLVVNTVGDMKSKNDSYSIRRSALTKGIPYYTTISTTGGNIDISAINNITRNTRAYYFDGYYYDYFRKSDNY